MLQGVPAPVHMVIDLTLCRGYIRHKPQPTSRPRYITMSTAFVACDMAPAWQEEKECILQDMNRVYAFCAFAFSCFIAQLSFVLKKMLVNSGKMKM